MENESFEQALEPQPSKRKRSSILKPPEKRVSRDSRTVSFSDRCIYKELHQDGTCDITNLFLREDMDLTMMDIVEPHHIIHNQTLNSSMDISMDRASMISNPNNSSLDTKDLTLTEDNMIDEKEQLPPSPARESSTPPAHQLSVTMTEVTPVMQIPQQQQQHTVQDHLSQAHHEKQKSQETHNNSSQMDLTLISQFMNTMPKVNSIDLPSVNYDTSTIYEKKMSLASDISGISSLNSFLIDKSPKDLNDSSFMNNNTTLIPRDNTTINCSMTRISDISSFANATLVDQSVNETFFGAFHDSNNLSINTSRTSGMDTLMHNIEALNECIQKVDQESEENRRKLDEEIDELFKFYRHIVNKDNKYEFAIKIFGLRYSIWLIIRINPETYPNEKLSLRFAVNKKDRHLYPFPEFAEAVKRCTKEGRHGYLTKFVINAQKFRRFLRIIGYRKPIK